MAKAGSNPVDKVMKKALRQLRLGNADMARRNLALVVKLAPDHLDGNYLLGTVMVEQGEIDLGVSYLRRALQINPRSAMVMNNLGNACRISSRLEEAAGWYRSALAEDGSLFQASFNLGLVLQRLGRYDEALEALQQSIAYNKGNGLAWLEMGRIHLAQGRPGPAVSCLQEAVAMDPASVTARRMLGVAQQDVGNPVAARAILSELQAEHIDDPLEAHLVRAWAGETPDRPPDDYVSRLFDDYAPRFDRELMGQMQYRVPDVMTAAIEEVAGPDRRFAEAADLGCGTGLVGERLRARCARLTGVDLSSKMAEIAKERGVYDRVEVQPIEAFLASNTDFDLLLAADVLIYVGRLDELFLQARRVTRQGALFAFSTEAEPERPFALRPSGRYAHGQKYVVDLAVRNGFKVAWQAPERLRMEGRRWIDGFVTVLEAT